jgi:hypothetical protein
MRLVMEFAALTSEEKKKEFITANQKDVKGLARAAEYLEFLSLQELCVIEIAKKISSMNSEEIREYLGLQDDLDESKKLEIKRTTIWCTHLPAQKE